MARKKTILAIPMQMADLNVMIAEAINDVLLNRNSQIIEDSIDVEKMLKDGFILKIIKPVELKELIKVMLESALKHKQSK